MKKIVIILITLFALSCNNQTNNKTNEKVEIKYVSSNYKNETKGKIEFSRIVKDSSNLNLIEGEISFNENYNTLQRITNKKIVSESEVDSIKYALKNNGFRENFDNYNKVIFVQMKPKNENDLEFLGLRHSIEEKISNRLSNAKLGEWIAGDLGPGGANMLFEVTEWEKSIKLIINILNTENLLSKSLILKRLNTAEDDWNYEIIYPIDYNGVFNQM